MRVYNFKANDSHDIEFSTRKNVLSEEWKLWINEEIGHRDWYCYGSIFSSDFQDDTWKHILYNSWKIPWYSRNLKTTTTRGLRKKKEDLNKPVEKWCNPQLFIVQPVKTPTFCGIIKSNMCKIILKVSTKTSWWNIYGWRCESETRAPSLTGLVEQYNQELCISSIMCKILWTKNSRSRYTWNIPQAKRKVFSYNSTFCWIELTNGTPTSAKIYDSD